MHVMLLLISGLEYCSTDCFSLQQLYLYLFSPF